MSAKDETLAPLPFDPWRTTMQEQLAMDLSAEQGLQMAIARGIADDKASTLAGGGLAVMKAVAECARNHLPMPDWLANEFVRRVRAVAGFSVASWDAPEAFGKPFPGHTHVSRLKKDASAGPVIWSFVRRLLESDPHRAIDEALFDDVAAHFGNKPGLGRSECQRIYYAVAPDCERIFRAGKTKKVAVRRTPR